MRFANVIWCGDTYFRGLNGLKTELQQLHFSSPLIRERTYIYIYITQQPLHHGHGPVCMLYVGGFVSYS